MMLQSPGDAGAMSCLRPMDIWNMPHVLLRFLSMVSILTSDLSLQHTFLITTSCSQEPLIGQRHHEIIKLLNGML
jgi:hypothetical protein